MPSVHRIEVWPKVADARAIVRKKKFESIGLGGKIGAVTIVDAYAFDAVLAAAELESIGAILANPVTSTFTVDGCKAPENFDWAVEVGFLPGVTDNVANTARQMAQDLLKGEFSSGEGVYSSQITFIEGEISKAEVATLAESMANPLINRISIKSKNEFEKAGGMPAEAPRVVLAKTKEPDEIPILSASDAELESIGREGIKNPDGSSRGPLALCLEYMRAIRDYFRKEGRNPTDVELESLAQTWSEHCKHTIFRDPLDEIQDGIFRRFIRRATDEIRERKKALGKDFCVSVFSDNSGVIEFDENHLVSYKVETHNSPSALDPFGGAITGIVGVNRDAIGTGIGAKPVINTYGYCFANPDGKTPLYRGPGKTQKMLLPRQIMDGVIAGVNSGGNCSGIPTNQGFMLFDGRYKGKPLVFVGTVGLLPKTVCGRPSWEKGARSGDYIVMVGGRVGQDGIHGATFSSETLSKGSPASAVQIGDPITQKKFSDAIVKEARDRGLFSSITDDGAGGLSSSVGEMARQSGGCIVHLEAVPLKYPNLEPWKIWVSESQERMTLAVPKGKWAQFKELMDSREVEATAIGEFTGYGRCVVEFGGRKAMDVELEFLHEGLPKRPMKSKTVVAKNEEPEFQEPKDLTQTLLSMLSRPNIAGCEFVAMQYDHEVQAGSVLKPLQGAGRVCADATVTRPVLDSKRGAVLAFGINPSYGDIDAYSMAANAVDTAVRSAICAGANPEHLAVLDNFCWPSGNDPERLAQLKDAARACYDCATAYGTPFISGKDSMFNDFQGFGEDGSPVKISVPPTILISALGVIEDCEKAVSIDAKMPGDSIYLVGVTCRELGGSEYFALMGERETGKRYIGNSVPKVDAEKNHSAYSAISKCIVKGVVASAASVQRGGLAVALAKTLMAGKLGAETNIGKISLAAGRDDYALFSESAGRVIVTVSRQAAQEFEETMGNSAFEKIGELNADGIVAVDGKDGKRIIETTVEEMLKAYKSAFSGY